MLQFPLVLKLLCGNKVACVRLPKLRSFQSDSEGDVTPTPSLETTEKPMIAKSEAKPEKKYDDNEVNEVNEAEEDKEDHGETGNAADDDLSEEEKNAGQGGRHLWNNKDLPEGKIIMFRSCFKGVDMAHLLFCNACFHELLLSFRF